MAARAFITGLAGLTLSVEERAFLRDAQPWGLIIFGRNVDMPQQLRRLTDDFRSTVGHNSPVLVDQEGGRVQRLGPPHWKRYPPGIAYGRLYDRDVESGREAARLGARLMAADLQPLGIDVDCLPLADVPIPAADPVIGDRAYGDNPEKVAAIGAAMAEGLLEGGVLPVLKHLPGHGRAKADSHKSLPIVETERAVLALSDFAAFRPLAGLPMGMTAHVVFSAFDPVAPATTSAIMVRDVIRGMIGFQGLLMSDDISMGALSGRLSHRAAAALEAGCDIILHCNGDLAEMQEVAGAVPILRGDAERRAAQALALRKQSSAFDSAAAQARFLHLMKQAKVEVLAS